MFSKLAWLAAAASIVVVTAANAAPASGIKSVPFEQSIAALESKYGGRLGVAALNTATAQRLGYRASERFAMCSTFKLLLVAAVLSRVDAGDESLEREVKFNAEDLQSYAPIARKHLQDGQMSIATLAAAAIQYSDNTAANLLLASSGGPAGLTDYLRSLGNAVTRLDRNEPDLNTNIKNDKRDTTTPSAMLATMRKLLVGDALSVESRERLIHWLIGNTTGDAKLRAGFDAAWKIGDKTGTCERSGSNDVAIIWPPGKTPWLVAVYYSGSTVSREQQAAVIAQVGRIISATFSRD